MISFHHCWKIIPPTASSNSQVMMFVRLKSMIFHQLRFSEKGTKTGLVNLSVVCCRGFGSLGFFFTECITKNTCLGGGFKHFYFYPYLGRWSNFKNIFQMGWNHQLVAVDGNHLDLFEKLMENINIINISETRTTVNEPRLDMCFPVSKDLMLDFSVAIGRSNCQLVSYTLSGKNYGVCMLYYAPFKAGWRLQPFVPFQRGFRYSLL